MKGSNTAEAEEVAASAAMLVFRAEVVTPMRELCESLEELRGSEPSGKIRSNTSADGKCTEVVLFKANARVGKYRFGLRLEQELANFSVKVQIKFAKLFGSHGLCHNCAK